MLVSELVALVQDYWPYLIVGSLAVHLLTNKFYKGLNRYPGPTVAAYTNWWRFFDAWKRTPELTHIELHRKHGDIVRLGPNVLSFADPKAIKEIYGLNKGFVKVNDDAFNIIQPSQHWSTLADDLPSLSSIPFNKRLLKANGCSPCLRPSTKTTTPNTVAVSTMHSPCRLSFHTSRSSIRPLMSS